MEIWDATEEDLYRAGMENLRRKDKCFAVDMLSFIRGAVSAEDEEEMRAVCIAVSVQPQYFPESSPPRRTG